MTGTQLTYLQVCENPRLIPHPIYYLQGEDDFILRDVLARIVSQFIDPARRDFNYTCLKGSKELKASDIVALSEEIPLSSDRRVICIENVQDMCGEERARFARYLPNASRSTIFVLLRAESDTDKARSPLGKELDEVVKRSAISIRCKMGERDLEPWILARFKKAGYEIRPDALHLFQKRTGTDLWMVHNEMEKLRAYLGSRRIITRADVQAVVTSSPSSRIYDLTDCIGRKDLQGALRIAEDLLKDEEDIAGILAYLSGFLQNLAKIKELYRETGSYLAVAERMKRKEYWVKKNLEVAAKFSEKDIRRAIDLILRADIGMKMGKDRRLLMELLLIHLCGGARY